MPSTHENGLQRISNELWDHAIDAVRNNDNGSALKYLDEALQIQPSNMKYISLKSEIYLSMRQEKRAVDFLRSCLAKFPTLTDLHLDLAIALYNKGDYDDSLSELLLCHGKLENDPDVHYFRGLNLIQKKQRAEAKVEFSKALALDSTLAKPHFALYTLYYAEGEIQKAMKELDLAIRFDSDNFDYRQEKIEKLRESMKTDEEYSEILKLIKACPNDIRAYIYSSEELLELGAVRDVISIATEGSEKWPEEPKFPEVLSDTFLKLGYVDNAMKQIDKALEMKPHDSNLITKKLNIMILKKDYDGAIEILDRELESDPSSENLKLLKAQTLSYKGDKDEARNMLSNLIESGSDDLVLMDSMLKAVQNLNEKHDYDDIVLKVCDDILKKDKERNDVLSAKISTMINSGMYQQVEEDTKRIIEEKGENAAEFRDYLIDSLILQEKIEEAKKEMEKIMPNDYNSYNILQDSVLKYMQNDFEGGRHRLDDITKKYNEFVTCYTVKWFENIIGKKKLDFISDMHKHACGEDIKKDDKTEQ